MLRKKSEEEIQGMKRKIEEEIQGLKKENARMNLMRLQKFK